MSKTNQAKFSSSLLLSFCACSFLLLLLLLKHLMGEQPQAETMRQQWRRRGGARFSEGFWRHPALVGHLRVLSITNASAANGQDVVAPVPPLPRAPLATTAECRCLRLQLGLSHLLLLLLHDWFFPITNCCCYLMIDFCCC